MNVGIIGAGHIAQKMARTLNALNNEGFCFYGIASRNQKKAEDFKTSFHAQKAFGNYEELIADPQVDLVYIATPHSCHYGQMKLCLKHHKPVLCEKILTSSAEETKDIYSSFEKEHVFLLEGMWTAFQPARLILADLLKKKEIGDLHSMKASFYHAIMQKERVMEKSLGGGALMDIGIYPLSYIFRTLGRDYSSFEVKQMVMRGDVDEKSIVEFAYPEGVTATCITNGNHLPKQEVLLVGSKGKITLDSVNDTQKIRVYTGGKRRSISCPHDFTGFEYELRAAKKALEEGKIQCEEWTHEDSLFVSSLIETLLKGVKRGENPAENNEVSER